MLPTNPLCPGNQELTRFASKFKSTENCAHRGADDQHNDNPYVGKYGEEGGDDEDGEGLDPPDLAGGHPGDADGRDGEQVEGGRPDDGAGAERLRLEIVSNDSNHCQENLRGRRSWGQRHMEYMPIS